MPTPRRLARLRTEPLEGRDLPAAGVETVQFTEAEPNDTLDLAGDIGGVSVIGRADATGSVGNSPAGAADVDWYRFALDRAAAVSLAASGSSAAPTVSLYVRDPFDPADPDTMPGYRLLEQATGAGPAGETRLDRELAAGEYFVAVSGDGNRWFHPLLADSGYDGEPGNYELRLSATPLDLAPGDGPRVIAGTPADGASLRSSPTVLRVSLSTPLNPDTVIPGETVSLTFHPAGPFGDGEGQDVPIESAHVSAAAAELQVSPAAPLAPGAYRLRLVGDIDTHFFALTDVDGVPLGADADHPGGRDVVLTFEVSGVEGGTASDDTPPTAHDLSDLTSAGLVQVVGVVGDDPTAPVAFDPSDVDLYHFRIDGPGRYAFAAEVFGRRIGSPLDAGVSLFAHDTGSGRLALLAGNDNTRNPAAASDGMSLPLLADPAVFAGLTAGDYYVAVSGRRNVPEPDRGRLPGEDGVFAPEVSHSGTAGRSRGAYVLNLRAVRDDRPPAVATVATDGPDGGAPTHVRVRFTEPMNLQQLAFRAFERTGAGSLAPVFVEAADGVRYHPRLVSYDGVTHEAVFLLLDRLPPGDHVLHLSAAQGLTDLAGHPLTGDGPGGDFVTAISVRGAAVSPVRRAHEPNDDAGRPQGLGVLFPRELEGDGVAIVRDAEIAVADVADGYQFEVLQEQSYFFDLTGSGLPAGTRLTLTDAGGVEVTSTTVRDGDSFVVLLAPGAYVVRLSGWTSAEASGVAYTLRVVLGGLRENPQPLTSGPAPVLRLRLAPAEPPASLPPPPVSPPPTDSTVPPIPTTPTTPAIPPTLTTPASVSPTPPPASPTVPPDTSPSRPGTAVPIPTGNSQPSPQPPAPVPQPNPVAPAPTSPVHIAAGSTSAGPAAISVAEGARVETTTTTVPSLFTALGAGPVGGVPHDTASPPPADPPRLILDRVPAVAGIVPGDTGSSGAAPARPDGPPSTEAAGAPVGGVKTELVGVGFTGRPPTTADGPASGARAPSVARLVATVHSGWRAFVRSVARVARLADGGEAAAVVPPPGHVPAPIPGFAPDAGPAVNLEVAAPSRPADAVPMATPRTEAAYETGWPQSWMAGAAVGVGCVILGARAGARRWSRRRGWAAPSDDSSPSLTITRRTQIVVPPQPA